MKEQINTERLGNPTALMIQRSFSGLGEQFLLGFGIHALDLAPWLMSSEVKMIHAFSPDPNTWAIQMEFESGAVSSLLFSGHGHKIYPDDQVTVYGERDAVIFVRDFHSLTYAHDGVYHTLHQINLAVGEGNAGRPTRGRISARAGGIRHRRRHW